MRISAERRGRPDRSNAGSVRNVDALRAGRRDSDNPRRGYPSRVNAGPARDIDRRSETRNQLQAQLRFTKAGADMTTADDSGAQITLLELDSTSSGKGASLIGIQDAAGSFAAVNLETAIAELNTAATATVDHGATTGRSDDDHTQYILVAGTRAFTGDQSMGTNKITSLTNGSASTDAAAYGQLTSHTGDSTKHFTVGSIDHGSIAGLADDDHTQYTLVAGTRAFTGHVTLNDDVLLKLGTGGDSTITYDGTNTTWDPKAVGSGYLRVNSKIGVNSAPSEEVHAADTVRADTFFNHNGTDGLTSDVSFSDGAGGTQSVTVRGGLITAWSGGGGGGGGGGG